VAACRASLAEQNTIPPTNALL
ncbi:hypothetical protein A2U01_0083182, partial [Trifolium medium]|nr:hypothetical protein [Trifolium medium]